MEELKRYESQGCLHQMFKKQAELTPDNIAVIGDDGTQVTFSELDRKTDILARILRSRGVTLDSTVGIYMERCIDYVVSYIAILKSGGAYMPLDVTYPKSLLCEVFSDARPACVISNDIWAKKLTGRGQEVIILTNDWEKTLVSNSAKCNGQYDEKEPSLDNLAYVVYSSGTTGKPKGIMCPHRGAVFSYTWRHLAYPFVPSDRVACNVFFVWEMLRPLLKGIPLYVIPDTVIYDPPLLAKFIMRHQITRILFTPSLLEAVLDTDDVALEDFKSLRVIWFCGEVVTNSLLGRCFKSLPWVQFLNLYSISECHDVAASDLTKYWKNLVKKEGTDVEALARRKFAPVGSVLPEVQVYILNDQLQLQPAGVPGEIYVGGPTLARGYLNRPTLNAKRFVDRPESLRSEENGKLYRTGDWGLMLANRVLEICGRCDSMVKIRGYSIETQAVEAALLEMPQVNACVVLTEGEEGTDKQLIAYVVPREGATKKEIRATLKLKLPIYMIPSYFVFLKQIPVLAASGKVDKSALPSAMKKSPSSENDVSGVSLTTPDQNLPSQNSDEDENGSPKTATERSMAEIWSNILQFNVTDVEESFFDLGGHSLLAAKLLGKIREMYGINMNVQTLFAHPTVAELSKMIDTHADSDLSRTHVKEIDLENEVKLNGIGEANLDIQLRAFWRSANYSHRWRTGRVLLTGATGFLGSYLLRDLLAKTQTQIYCLVRKSPEIGNMERLRNTMKFYELFHKENGDEDVELVENFNHRVHPVSGDVALLELGMSEEDFAYLSFEIDFVIHAAAYVNLLYPYEALKGTNVFGTRNVLHFSTVGKIKPMHYISTNSVFPNHLENCKEVSSKKFVTGLEDGYSQSKWVAEQLVMNAIESGLPASIYRMGNISGDRINGGWNASDFILLVLRASLDAGAWPDIEWKIEMTPVDFVSNAVIQLSQKVSCSVHKVFHLVNPNTISSGNLYEYIKGAGYDLAKVPFHTWCEQISVLSEKASQPAGHPSPRRMLDAVISSKDPSLFSFDTTYDQTVFNGVLKSFLKQEYPKLTAPLIEGYLRGFARRNVIPKPHRTFAKELQGKVVLVTGASSGIGQAIAINLAKSGAKVCLAARRREKLSEAKRKIADLGGFAEIFSLDVTDRRQFASVVEEIEERIGPIDILVNNAGVMYYTHMHNVMMDDWDWMIEVNCRGVTNGIGTVLPGMLKRGSGHIINTSSDAGRRGFAGLAVYSGTKFFVEGLSQGLRQEVKGKGIKVTCIQPGDVKTELLSHTNDFEAKEEYDGSEGCKILDPDDIGRAVLYAVTQPDHVGVNEILIEPKENPI